MHSHTALCRSCARKAMLQQANAHAVVYIQRPAWGLCAIYPLLRTRSPVMHYFVRKCISGTHRATGFAVHPGCAAAPCPLAAPQALRSWLRYTVTAVMCDTSL